MLRITKQADYGIVLLTRFTGNGERSVHNARDLAAETRLPLPTVSKILKALARDGLLLSHRGVKGGYSLARPAREVSVADIIRALDGPIAMTECLDIEGSDCGIESCCPVRSNWARINRAVRLALAGIPLTEMVPVFSRPPRPMAAARRE
ncbi:MAG: SUF system Fe-S cluster assembly regulator [Planctomycetota bacterium]